MKKLLAIAAATMAFAVLPAQAQPSDISPNPSMEPATNWNRDRSGRNEYPNAQHFLVWDRNGNGLLDDMEWKMIEDNWGGTSSQAFSEFDNNNDGRLDQGERNMVRREFNRMQIESGRAIVRDEDKP